MPLPAEIPKPVSKTDVTAAADAGTNALTEKTQIRTFLLIPMQIS